MSIRIEKDNTPKVELDEKTKHILENMCQELFADISPIIEWRYSENGAELLGIFAKKERYIIRYLDKNTIEFYKNSSIFRSKAKNIEGLRKGIETMILLEKEINKFNETIF